MDTWRSVDSSSLFYSFLFGLFFLGGGVLWNFSCQFAPFDQPSGP